MAAHIPNPINSSGISERNYAVIARKERLESMVRAKRLCTDRVPLFSDMKDKEQSILDAQTSSIVEELKSVVTDQREGAMQKRVSVLRELRHLLSGSEHPPIEAALKSGVVPLLVQCLSFGSQDEQLLETAWCLTNIAAGKPEQTEALLPALPLLIAHLSANSSSPVSEQCAWAVGNVAGEGDELRKSLLKLGALRSLARMMVVNKGSTVKIAARALSNLIKGHPRAVKKLLRVHGLLPAILQHLKTADEVTATEVAWVAVHLSVHVDIPTSWLVKHNVLQLIVQRLATSNSLQLLRPVLYILGNLVAADSYPASAVQISGQDITGELVNALIKCLTLKSDRQVLKKEAAWVLYNVAAGSVQHKQLIYNSGAVPILSDQLSNPKLELKKEAAYVLVYLCIVPPAEAYGEPVLLMGHFNRIARRCLPAFIDLAKSPDVEATTLGLQFIGLTLSVMPNGEGKKLVELHGGMDIIEGCNFCENRHLQNMAYALLQKFFEDEFEFSDVRD